MVLKCNKCEKYQQKITNILIIERHVLVDNYFYARVSHLLDFNTNDVVPFYTKYFYFDVMITPQV